MLLPFSYEVGYKTVPADSKRRLPKRHAHHHVQHRSKSGSPKRRPLSTPNEVLEEGVMKENFQHFDQTSQDDELYDVFPPMDNFRSRCISDSTAMARVKDNRLLGKHALYRYAVLSGVVRDAERRHRRHSENGDDDQEPLYTFLYTKMSGDTPSVVEHYGVYTDDDCIFSKFMQTNHCYDLIPTSAKLVVFDTQLPVKKAFFALVYNGVRAAPLWDNDQQKFIGMLTITDFINILHMYYKSPLVDIDELEQHKISTWRDVLKDNLQPLVYLEPESSLLQAVQALIYNKVHRLPVIAPGNGDVLHVLTHKRILKFLYLKLIELPLPSFMNKTIKELKIGSYEDIAFVRLTTPLFEAFSIFLEKRVSALPVLDKEDRVVDIYAKFDVIHLAAARTYNNLDVSVAHAISHRRHNHFEGVATCTLNDTLGAVVQRIVKAEVHRLIIVDAKKRVLGVLSLSDLLTFLVLKPIGLAPEDIESDLAPTNFAADDDSSLPLTQPPITNQNDTVAMETDLVSAKSTEILETASAPAIFPVSTANSTAGVTV